jgi:Uma2 family endonuclease
MTERSSYIDDVTTPDLVTSDELLVLNLPNKRTELVRGRLVVREPAGFQHGVIAVAVAARLADFVRANALGVVVAAETGFKLFTRPDTVRAPDAGFIKALRVPNPLPRGYAAFAPDLAVEVLSPDDRAGEVLEKVADWLRAGTQLVWVIDPDRHVVRVYRADGSESLLADDALLDGEDVLPGFSCQIAEIL